MSSGSNRVLLLAALAAVAFATNPDEQSFQKHIDRAMKECVHVISEPIAPRN